jgi:hypothetical protein
LLGGTADVVGGGKLGGSFVRGRRGRVVVVAGWWLGGGWVGGGLVVGGGAGGGGTPIIHQFGIQTPI